MALTDKQRVFARLYVELGVATEAYRRSYNAGGMLPATISRKAQELLKNGTVAAFIEDLQERHAARAAEKHDITVDSLTQMLLNDREAANKAEQYSVCVAAVKEIARLHGLGVTRAEVTGKDGAPLQTTSNLDVLISRLAQIAKREDAQE